MPCFVGVIPARNSPSKQALGTGPSQALGRHWSGTGQALGTGPRTGTGDRPQEMLIEKSHKRAISTGYMPLRVRLALNEP